MAETDVAGTVESTGPAVTDEVESPRAGVSTATVDDGPAAVPGDAEGETGVLQSDVSDVDDVDQDDDTDEDAEEDEDEDDDSEDESSEGSGVAGSRRGRRGSGSLKRLEEEGEVAADYLEELLDITDLDGDIDIDVENGRASVAIVADPPADRDLRRLAGPRGEVLEALQELSRLAVQARTGERSRLMLDVAGFRAARRRTLEDVAARACQEVQRGGQPLRLDPMTAFERKVVHDVVAAAGLRSESEGEDPGRRVVVFPAS